MPELLWNFGYWGDPPPMVVPVLVRELYSY